MGIGDWGLGIGDWGLGPIPNPQTPNPKTQPQFKKIYKKKYYIVINQDEKTLGYYLNMEEEKKPKNIIKKYFI